MSRLLLFDIDCTLIDTGGAGMAALKQTASELFGAEGPELDLAGSTDWGIVRGMLEHFDSDMQLEDFYSLYLEKLSPNLAAFEGKVLPGVTDLLDEVKKSDAFLGLLTGNIAHGAQAKISHYGLDGYFSIQVGAYGDDHYDRNQLGPVALDRASSMHEVDFKANQSVVIGDTPKDIACGQAMGATTLAVATGRFSVAELEAYGADLVVEDLCDSRVSSFLE